MYLIDGYRAGNRCTCSYKGHKCRQIIGVICCADNEDPFEANAWFESSLEGLLSMKTIWILCQGLHGHHISHQLYTYFWKDSLLPWSTSLLFNSCRLPRKHCQWQKVSRPLVKWKTTGIRKLLPFEHADPGYIQYCIVALSKIMHF